MSATFHWYFSFICKQPGTRVVHRYDAPAHAIMAICMQINRMKNKAYY
jgi:hypothetical protein